ncbi:hypothetical protein DOE63_24795 [Salmonella enterica subsp. diarizonae serovar 59:z10:-]|nr:hypothetical protein DOE63_24795 [Salmonella enterica subsp. diarizonae serovar 59:z10:-]
MGESKPENEKIIISALSPCNSLQEPGDLISNECYFRNKERNNKTNNKKTGTGNVNTIKNQSIKKSIILI